MLPELKRLEQNDELKLYFVVPELPKRDFCVYFKHEMGKREISMEKVLQDIGDRLKLYLLVIPAHIGDMKVIIRFIYFLLFNINFTMTQKIIIQIIY